MPDRAQAFQNLAVPQGVDVLLQVVDQPPRRADQQVGVVGEELALLPVVDATVDRLHGQTGELAQLLGLARSTLSEVEGGKYLPPAELAVWLLKELNAPPQEWGKYGIEAVRRQEGLSGERAGAGMVGESPLGRVESEAVQRLLRLLHTGDKRLRRHLLQQLRLLEDASAPKGRTAKKR
jgi:transcriptional regulator with XRE-family HTH domain